MEIKFTEEFHKDMDRLFSKDLKYRIWRSWDWLKGVPSEVKFFWQRGTRGWSDRDVWGIDNFLLSILPGMLRQLAITKHGCPEEFYDDHCKGDECHMWREFLNDMADKLECGTKALELELEPFKKADGSYDMEAFKAEYERLVKEWGQGIDWVKKYFFNLWD